MGWETRNGNGKYYTRSRKIDGRVIREYIGTGKIAQLAAELDRLERQRHEERRAAIEKEYQQAKAQETVLIEYCKAVDDALAKVLTAAGYHKHRGQWRKGHGKKEDCNRTNKP